MSEILIAVLQVAGIAGAVLGAAAALAWLGTTRSEGAEPLAARIGSLLLRRPDPGPACVIEPEGPDAPGPRDGTRWLLMAAGGLALMLAGIASFDRSDALAEARPTPEPGVPADRLGVSFTFAPTEVTPGEEVSIHLSPPWPAEVLLDGEPLPSEITNGGRTLIVRVPEDAVGTSPTLALSASGRIARADTPLVVVPEKSVQVVALAPERGTSGKQLARGKRSKARRKVARSHRSPRRKAARASTARSRRVARKARHSCTGQWPPHRFVRCLARKG